MKTAFGLLALAAVLGALILGVDHYRRRFVRSNTDLARLLPPGDLTLFFADFDTLRRADMLRLLAGVKPADEKQYGEFVAQTKLDYLRDVDALAGASDGEQLFFLIRGRFDWNKLKQYALAHGGVCQHDYCTAPTSRPGRWANFMAIQPDVIGLAVSANGTAADLLRPPARRLQEQMPADPVWVKPSLKLMKTPADVPLAVRIFAISLQSANSVVLSATQGSAGGVAVQLNATFENEATAESARNQMELQTKMLKSQLAREQQPTTQTGQQSSPVDPTALLTSGTFQVVSRRLIGIWPVRLELLRALE